MTYSTVTPLKTRVWRTPGTPIGVGSGVPDVRAGPEKARGLTDSSSAVVWSGKGIDAPTGGEQGSDPRPDRAEPANTTAGNAARTRPVRTRVEIFVMVLPDPDSLTAR